MIFYVLDVTALRWSGFRLSANKWPKYILIMLFRYEYFFDIIRCSMHHCYYLWWLQKLLKFNDFLCIRWHCPVVERLPTLNQQVAKIQINHIIYVMDIFDLILCSRHHCCYIWLICVQRLLKFNDFLCIRCHCPAVERFRLSANKWPKYKLTILFR